MASPLGHCVDTSLGRRFRWFSHGLPGTFEALGVENQRFPSFFKHFGWCFGAEPHCGIRIIATARKGAARAGGTWTVVLEKGLKRGESPSKRLGGTCFGTIH